MTKEEFNFWKNSPETQEVFDGFRRNIERATQELVLAAGTDPLHDRYLVGAIAAYNDLMLITHEDITSE